MPVDLWKQSMIVFPTLAIWNFRRMHYRMPPAGLVCVSCPLPKKVDTKLVLTGSSEKKNGADMLYQTLLELMTKPSEMCCIDCRQRTLWSWNKEEDTLAEAGPSRNLNNALSSCPRLSSPHTQTVKPGFNAVSPWEFRIGPRMFIVQTKHWEFFHWLGDDKLVIVCIYCFFFPHSTDFVVLIEEFGQIAQLQGWWLIGKFRKKCFFVMLT